MILTVTPNTSIDRTLVLPHFRWGETIRSREGALGMGGKGADASWILAELGIPTLALGFAAGLTGRTMQTMLEARGARTDFTWVEGETRTSTILIDQASGQHTTITTDTLEVSPAHIRELTDKFVQTLPAVKSAIIGGSLPPGVPAELYFSLVDQAGKAGIPVLFDSSGPGLQAGLRGRPTLIKPNRAELASLLGKDLPALEDVLGGARQIQETYGCMVVATLGAEGALAVAGQDCWFIAPLPVKTKSAAGAGDAVLAGLAHALAHGRPLEEGLRLGFGAAAAVLQTLATADCRKSAVDALVPQIQIRRFG